MSERNSSTTPRAERWKRVAAAPWLRTVISVALLPMGCTTIPEQSIGDDWQPPATNWQLVWNDEFDGAAGTEPNPENWISRVQGENFNEELQFYTDDRANSYLDGTGNLVIKAQRQSYQDHDFTSARLESKGLFAQQYGAFEARIRLPTGKGLWPAFWLLGDNYDQVGWPNCGEVDILELGGSEPDKVTSSLHSPGFCGGGGTPECGKGPFSRDFVLPDSQTFAQDFHVFRFEWLADGVRWLVDGQPYHARAKQTLDAYGMPWVYDHPFFIILNVAVGGLYDGNPNAQTVFPQTMQIDYVRVYTLPNQGSTSVFKSTPPITN
jgi:beta-glucanase (GH16 family)